MHSIPGVSLIHRPTCSPCRPVQRAFAPDRHSKQQRKSSVHPARCQRIDGAIHVASQNAISQPVHQLAVNSSYGSIATITPKANFPIPLSVLAAIAGVALLVIAIKRVFDTPSRAYKENVGQEYDSWTDDGVLEYYWGEHIHLGYYTGSCESVSVTKCHAFQHLAIVHSSTTWQIVVSFPSMC